MNEDPPVNGPRGPMGLLIVGSEMVSFTLFGLLLDYILGTLPVFTVVFTLLGVAAAFLTLVRMAKALTGTKPKPPNDTPERN